MTGQASAARVPAFHCGDCDSYFLEPEGPVYECSRCGGTQVDENRCMSCNVFMAKVADSSCPDCESGEDIEALWAYRAIDGELFETAEEAVDWVADAPVREQRAAEARADLDARLAEHERERQERAAALIPRLRTIRARLDPKTTPRLCEAIDSNLERLSETNPFPHDLPVGFPELARLLLDPDIEADLAVLDDYDVPWDDRQVVEEPLRAQIAALVVTDELIDRVDSFFGYGVTLSVKPEIVCDELEAHLGISDSQEAGDPS